MGAGASRAGLAEMRTERTVIRTEQKIMPSSDSRARRYLRALRVDSVPLNRLSHSVWPGSLARHAHMIIVAAEGVCEN